MIQEQDAPTMPLRGESFEAKDGHWQPDSNFSMIMTGRWLSASGSGPLTVLRSPVSGAMGSICTLKTPFMAVREAQRPVTWSI